MPHGVDRNKSVVSAPDKNQPKSGVDDNRLQFTPEFLSQVLSELADIDQRINQINQRLFNQARVGGGNTRPPFQIRASLVYERERLERRAQELKGMLHEYKSLLPPDLAAYLDYEYC